MSFDRAWVLAIAWLPLAWGYLEWRRTSRKLGLALKAATFTLILLALAQPRLNISTTKVAVGVLVDTSASVSTADLERASKIAVDIDSSRGSNAMRVIPFARSTRVADAREDQKPWKLRLTSGGPGRATDLEAAVREAISSVRAVAFDTAVPISSAKLATRSSVPGGSGSAWSVPAIRAPHTSPSTTTGAPTSDLMPRARSRAASRPDRPS